MTTKEYIGNIAKITNMTKDVKVFKIELNEEINFQAGQFVYFTITGDDNEEYAKPYSISVSSHKNQKTIELCIKLVTIGKVTPQIFNQKEGNKVKIRGPFGLFNIGNLTPTQEKLIFIGTGTGIAPLRSMINTIIKEKTQKQITLIQGTRYENQILFEKEFEQLEQENPNFQYLKIISKPTKNWQGRIGHVQDNFDTIDVLSSEIYICGLPAMIDSSKEKLETIGMNKERIHIEKY